MLSAAALLAPGGASRLHAQGKDVPVYSESSAVEDKIRASAEKFRLAGKLLDDSALNKWLTKSNWSCELKLPAPSTSRLSGRDLWGVARAAHLRIGWYYLCKNCNNRHINLGAGYAITKDGAVATCYHVIAPVDGMKEGYLVVADESGQIYPIKEILAANKAMDACILRVEARNLKPLPLNTDVYPGDRCVCFSDPLGERGYFSDGIISRFLVPRPAHSGTNAPVIKNMENVTRLNVTTDWAPGSSGAAVLDECGNAIGHVTSIATLGEANGRGSGRNQNTRTLITIHEAVSAKDVLSLVRKPAKK